MKEETSNTEQSILKAAEKEFLKKGFSGSKTTEIAKEAGVTHAMLHYYFRTKENLFNKVFEEKARQLADTFLSRVDESLPFLEKIKCFIEAHFDLLTANPELPLFIYREILTNECGKEICRKTLFPNFRLAISLLDRSLQEEIKKGTVRPVKAEDKQIKNMKRLFILTTFLLGISPICLNAQELTLEECQQQAQAHYPLIKRYGLIEKTKEYNISNAGKGYLPQVSLSAKASYQSDVTEIPVDLPGIDIRGIRKDQYQAMLQLDQVVWDGGNIRARKEVTRATSEVDKQKLEVDMYAINERVNQLFFGILLLKEQLKQNQLMQEELQRNYDNVAAYVKNGIANQADLDAVKVEQLNNIQQRHTLEATYRAYGKMLSLGPQTSKSKI